MLPRIQILSTGEFLKLSTDGFSVVIRSVLFQDQADLLGSLSYPGTMSLEDNRAALKNAHIFNSDAAGRTFEVRIWLGALPWNIAKLNYIIKDGDISYTLYINLASAAQTLKNLKLNKFPNDPNYAAIGLANENNMLGYMYSTVLAEPGAMPLVFFPYKNDGAYQQIAPEDYDSNPSINFPVDIIINPWKIDSEGIGEFLWEDGKYTQTPFFYLVYILKRICSYLGYRPIGKWLEDPAANRIVMHSNLPVQTSMWIIEDFTGYMPDISVADFLLEVRKRYGLLIDFNQLDGTCLIESLGTLIAIGKTIDLRDHQLVEYDELYAGKAFSVSDTLDSNDGAWADSANQMPVLSIGEVNEAIELTPIQLSGAGTKMVIEPAPEYAQGALWKLPWIKTPLSGALPLYYISDVKYADRSNFSLRFLYYHGLRPNANGSLYPYGSSDHTDLYGNPLANYSLAIDAPDNVTLAVRDYYEFLKNSKPFEMGFNLTPQQFLSILPQNKVLVRDPYTQGSVICLLDEISADISAKEMVQAKAKLYPILLPPNKQQVFEVTPVDEPPDYDNGTVYVVLIQRNQVREDIPQPPVSNIYRDIYAQFYEDEAATIPKDVTRLDLQIKITHVQTGIPTPEVSVTIVRCTSVDHEFEVYHKALVATNGNGSTHTYAYELIPNFHYHIL